MGSLGSVCSGVVRALEIPWCLEGQGTGSQKRARGAGGLLKVSVVISDPDRAAGQVTGKWHQLCRSTAPWTEGGKPFQESLCQTSQQPCEVGNSPDRGPEAQRNAVAWPRLGTSQGQGRSFPALVPSLWLLPLGQQSMSSPQSHCWAWPRSREQGTGNRQPCEGSPALLKHPGKQLPPALGAFRHSQTVSPSR